jgi:Flp pilus assembly protein CpaB
VQNIFSGKVFSTRAGTIGLGVAAAVLAGLLLVVYLNRYRNSVNESAAATPVLVAKALIPKNTPGAQIATRDLFQVQQITKEALKPGAIVDAGYLNGRQAVTDIFPGQQLTTADFTVGVSDALPTRIEGKERAIAIPIDGPSALVGLIGAGDHVDIYVAMDNGQAGIVGLLERNILVMTAPTTGTTGVQQSAGQIVLEAKDTQQAQRLLWANQNGKLWFVARPATGAKETPLTYADVNSVLLGLKPVRVKR